jgi:hypothetical protein
MPLCTPSPRPSFPVQTPIMNRLRQILNPDIRTPGQIRCRPRYLQYPVKRPRRKLQPFFASLGLLTIISLIQPLTLGL